jgi:hypothetical protein
MKMKLMSILSLVGRIETAEIQCEPTRAGQPVLPGGLDFLSIPRRARLNGSSIKAKCVRHRVTVPEEIKEELKKYDQVRATSS